MLAVAVAAVPIIVLNSMTGRQIKTLIKYEYVLEMWCYHATTPMIDVNCNTIILSDNKNGTLFPIKNTHIRAPM